MGLLVVQSAQAASTSLLSTTLGVVLGNTRKGNLLVVCCNGGVHQVTGVSDGTNTYVSADTGGFAWSDCEIWYAKNVAGLSAPTVTVTVAVAEAITIQVYEIQGADPDSPLSAHGNANGDGVTSNLPTMSITAGANQEILIATCNFFSGSGTNLPTVGAGFTNFQVTNSTPTIGANVSAGAETAVVGQGPITAAFGLASPTTTWEITAASFKELRNYPSNNAKYLTVGNGFGRAEVAN